MIHIYKIVYTLKAMSINSMEIDHCGYTQVVSSQGISIYIILSLLGDIFLGRKWRQCL